MTPLTDDELRALKANTLRHRQGAQVAQAIDELLERRQAGSALERLEAWRSAGPNRRYSIEYENGGPYCMVCADCRMETWGGRDIPAAINKSLDRWEQQK